MNTTFLKISLSILLLAFMMTGCEKEEKLPPFYAKGRIIAVTSMCYGEVVLIEVENPKGIGLPGTFSYIGENNKVITYKNAIGVPYFSKIGIPQSVPQKVGTWLYFEYRELTDEEKKDGSLFSPNPPIVCPAIYCSPVRSNLIITKVVEFE